VKFCLSQFFLTVGEQLRELFVKDQQKVGWWMHNSSPVWKK